jgi:hypothetical protein
MLQLYTHQGGSSSIPKGTPDGKLNVVSICINYLDS